MDRSALVTRPRRILMATDLTHRCDRALDRALLLAKAWDAGLVVAHALPAQASSADRVTDPVLEAELEISRGLPADNGAKVRVVEGDVVDSMLRIAAEEGCGLIVTGFADEDRVTALGGTKVNRLIRQSPVPVLAVQERAARPYSQIVAATDFSGVSADALLCATALFPAAEFTLLHAHDVPAPPISATDPLDDSLEEMERRYRAEFMNALPIEPALRARMRLMVVRGAPQHVVPEHVRDHQVDLTVIGSHGRGVLFDLLIGSMTKRILHRITSDLLMVPGDNGEE